MLRWCRLSRTAIKTLELLTVWVLCGSSDLSQVLPVSVDQTCTCSGGISAHSSWHSCFTHSQVFDSVQVISERLCRWGLSSEMPPPKGRVYSSEVICLSALLALPSVRGRLWPGPGAAKLRCWGWAVTSSACVVLISSKTTLECWCALLQTLPCSNALPSFVFCVELLKLFWLGALVSSSGPKVAAFVRFLA